MARPKYTYVDRATFLRDRYQSFLASKQYLDEVDPTRAVSHLTDLDDPTLAIGGVPLRDVVLCDRCNEPIQEPAFVFFEASMCYHRACVASDPWFRKDDNVTPLKKKE